MGVVIVPCWRRPAHLAAALACIQRARRANSNYYLFAIDREPDERVFDVIDTFELPRRILGPIPHEYSGPAFNILHAYEAALAIAEKQNEDFIGLIEDDILVAEDVFEFWDDALDADPIAMCVSACKNQMATVEAPTAEIPRDQLIYRHESYQSLGVALRKELVAEVCEHIKRNYFRDPISYCMEHLPDPGLENWEASQDGLFHRIIRRRHYWTLYPIVPRAFHAGWYGVNRAGKELVGSWRENAERILAMTGDQMNELADPKFRDIERCELIRPRVPLTLI
jgi:hypothetical protein